MISSLSRHHRLRIICVNDVYSFTAVDGHGGWERAATLMRELKDEISRNETEQSSTGSVVSSSLSSSSSALTFVNGDVMGGSSLLQHSKGRLAVEIMNEVPIDGCVLGNVRTTVRFILHARILAPFVSDLFAPLKCMIITIHTYIFSTNSTTAQLLWRNV